MAAIANITYLEPATNPRKRINKSSTTWSIRLVRFGFNTLGRLFPKLGGKLAYRLFSTPRMRAKHRVSDATMEQARVFEFLYGSQMLKGYEWGSGEQTILLVHGWESRGTALRKFVPSLLEKGYRVVAFDGPAHGDSSGTRTNLVHFGGAVKAAINHLGGVYGIITHSFGGSSTVYALANIDRSIPIEKLVLIGVPSDIEKVLISFLRMIAAPPNVQKEFEKIIASKIEGTMETIDMAKSYSRMSVEETLVVHDKKDTVVPFSEAERTFEFWENTSMLVSDGYGHFQLLKKKELIGEVVSFIEN